MSPDDSSALDPTAPAPRTNYTVVARRYRPRLFDELVGQQHVARALCNAITTDRVGHAYLFTGARGVGKTSTARIFAKALNSPGGPSPTPDGATDVAQAIDAGEDVDVLEIDGASNRGIDEIRQLRANVNIRPSRSRFKIYIIDEVHMLTTAAFNALLKTLEEPPSHVKFIFCTTDPEKIPITVLSRCQRFDFAPVATKSIADRLQYIAEQEKVNVEPDALQMLAKRAGGSMRDSQSLLEQLLSYCGETISADDVHALLGTAQGGRLQALTDLLAQRQPGAAIAELDQALADGVDAGQLTEQLIGHYRDMLSASVGCPADLLLHSSAEQYEQLQEAGKQLGIENLLAILQIVDQTLTRMRQSSQARTLLEMALVRICHLENLEDLGQLVQKLKANTPTGVLGTSSGSAAARPAASNPPRPAQKKTVESASQKEPIPPSGAGNIPLTADNASSIWKQVLSDLGDMTADAGRYAETIAISAPNRLVVTFTAQYTLQKETCERRKSRIEEALARHTGQTARVEFTVQGEAPATAPSPTVAPSRRQLMREMENDPFVKKAIEVFDAEITRLDTARPR